MNSVRCGRADPISRQGGWEQTCIGMTSTLWRGVERHVSWSDPVRMSSLPGILKIKPPNALRISRTPSHLGAILEFEGVFDTLRGVSLWKNVKTGGGGLEGNASFHLTMQSDIELYGKIGTLCHLVYETVILVISPALALLKRVYV